MKPPSVFHGTITPSVFTPMFQRMLSLEVTKTSRRPSMFAATEGVPVSEAPPRLVHAPQVCVDDDWTACHNAWSVPSPKTSRHPVGPDAAAVLLMKTPPKPV